MAASVQPMVLPVRFMLSSKGLSFVLAELFYQNVLWLAITPSGNKMLGHRRIFLKLPPYDSMASFRGWEAARGRRTGWYLAFGSRYQNPQPE